MLADDDVLDYMIMEAIALKVHKEDEKAQKAAEVKRWQAEQREEMKKYQ